MFNKVIRSAKYLDLLWLVPTVTAVTRGIKFYCCQSLSHEIAWDNFVKNAVFIGEGQGMLGSPCSNSQLHYIELLCKHLRNRSGIYVYFKCKSPFQVLFTINWYLTTTLFSRTVPLWVLKVVTVTIKFIHVTQHHLSADWFINNVKLWLRPYVYK